MSELNDIMTDGFSEVQPAMDDVPFSIRGVSFSGVFSESEEGVFLEAGGKREQIRARITAARDQFVTAGITPVDGMIVVRQGQRWKIDVVSDDDAVFVDLDLIGMNQ